MSIISAIFRLAKNLPQTYAIPLCQFTAFLFLVLKKRYRNEIKVNYQKIFGFYKPSFWFKQSLRLGKNLGLMLQIGKDNKKILDKIQIYGENILCKVMESNQSAVVVSFHYGVWELLPQIFQKQGYETYIGVRDQRNRFLANKFEELRNYNGVKTLRTVAETKNVLKPIELSKQKKLLGFVLDNTSKTRQLRLNSPWPGFSILRTPFVLAKSAQKPILSMFCYNQSNKVVVDVEEVNNPIELGERLQTYIKKYPEEWIFWGKSEIKN